MQMVHARPWTISLHSLWPTVFLTCLWFTSANSSWRGRREVMKRGRKRMRFVERRGRDKERDKGEVLLDHHILANYVMRRGEETKTARMYV